MSLRLKGDIWHYRFSLRGRRHEGSTGETKENRARLVESDKMREAMESRLNPLFRKAPTVAEYSERFLKWVDESPKLKPKTRKYYRNGWRLLKDQKIVKLRLDALDGDSADTLVVEGSNSNLNNALRTLRRMLGRAKEEKILRALPEIELYAEEGREAIVEPWAEDLLLEFAGAVLHDVITVMLDCGMRPEEVAQMRWEHINWTDGAILVARGKSASARRHVPLTERMRAVLKARPSESEWVFPSEGGKSGRKSKSGHVLSGSFDKAWGLLLVKVRKAAQERRFPPPPTLVLYSCRHTFATMYLKHGGDLGTLMRIMGHTSITTTQKYLHLVDALDAANVMNKHNERKRIALVKRA